MLKKNIIILSVIFVLISSYLMANKRQQMLENFERQRSQMLNNYETEKKQMTVDWENQRKEIEQKWHNYRNSTKKELVSYSEDLNSRSIINFEEGYIEVEAIVEDQEEDSDQKVINILREKVNNVIETKDVDGTLLIKDQIDTTEKEEKIIEDIDLPAPPKPVVPIKKYVDNLIETKTEKTEPLKSKDEKERVVATVKIPLISNHLLIRAKKYLELVNKYSEQYDLPPEFVFAVMETESHFNPYAKSHIPAYGLMQLVPRTGAYDASKVVFGKNILLKPDELYDPETNIHLGIAYFHLIFNRYLRRYRENEFVHLLASTASYNCGPTRVNRILRDFDFENMDNQKFYVKFKSRLPNETKNYIDKVLNNTDKYRHITEI
jgi:membrane-bound lytic murein transglycosylase C